MGLGLGSELGSPPFLGVQVRPVTLSNKMTFDGDITIWLGVHRGTETPSRKLVPPLNPSRSWSLFFGQHVHLEIRQWQPLTAHDPIHPGSTSSSG